MRRVLFLLILFASTFCIALTPISLQFGETTAVYYEEFLRSFDASGYDDAEISSILQGDKYTLIRSDYLNFIETVRLIGFDTPNSHDSHEVTRGLGSQAAEFAKSLLENKEVFLSYDENLSIDTYGDFLAYLWLPVERQGEQYLAMFNLLAIANGYGRTYTEYPFNEGYVKAFTEAESVAKNDRLGLWKNEEFESVPPEPEYNPVVYITDTGKKYHRIGCQHLEDSCHEIRLSDALRRGYTPCSVCNPYYVNWLPYFWKE